MKRKVVIIGAGASGMMAALAAADAGAEVLVLEHNDRVGKKILATGNGRCNMTNLEQDISCYRCDDRGFVQEVLNRFDVQRTIRFFSRLGIYTKNRDGYIYPNSDQSSAVLDVLRIAMEHSGIKVLCETHVTAVKKNADNIEVHTDSAVYSADACILAAGSRAGNVAGADGSGYELAKQAGHNIVKPVPALVQLRSNEKWLKSVAGVRSTVTVSLYAAGELIAQDLGEMLFTAYGLSGIPVFQISRFAARALDKKKKVEVSINFLPDFEKDVLPGFIKMRIQADPDKTAEQFFIGLLNKKTGKIILDRAGISMHKRCASLSEQELERLQEALQYFKVPVHAVNSFREAQVCAGGVPLDELHCPDMESEKMKNLHITGELTDVDGACGGYNLQWAWSTGYIAGRAAAGGNDA